MPPRVRMAAGPSAHLRRHDLLCPHNRAQQSRAFASTPVALVEKRRSKRLPSIERRRMYDWLAGPGKNFLDPLPGSTNYLNARSEDGRLLRLSPATVSRRRDEDEDDADGGGEDGGEGGNGARAERDGGGEGGKDDGFLKNTNGDYLLDADGRRVRKLPPELEADFRPFPLNRYFRSENVLSDEVRDEIYDMLTRRGMSVREVSVRRRVSMERVAAVYRLKEVEKQWVAQGKKLETVYSEKVLEMLPRTKLKDKAHESINDLPVHPATLPQIFLPTAESRRFTRVDASRVFQAGLLPAEARIPHPQMVEDARDELLGLTSSAQRTRRAERLQQMQDDHVAATDKARRALARHTTVVPGARYDFKFIDAVADDAGKDGRGRHARAHRYGVPSLARSKGRVHIPTSVE